MFERYTDGARKTIFFSRDEALKRGSGAIAPEHLLLGLLRSEPELMQSLTSGSAHTVDELRLSINAVLPSTSHDPTLKEIALSAEAKEVLHAAFEASESFNHHHIGVEHLLLGLFSEENRYGQSLATTIDMKILLSQLGFDEKIIEDKIRNGIR